MISYDSNVIREFADALYRRAQTIVMVSVVTFAAIGALAGYSVKGGFGAAIAAALGAVIGGYLGTQKAFVLKLQAQTSLCQVQIEANTQPAEARELARKAAQPVVVGKFECPPGTPMSIWREDLMRKMNVTMEGDAYRWNNERYDSLQSLVSAMKLQDAAA